MVEGRNIGTDERMSWEDIVVYALSLAGVYLLIGVLFFYSGKSKVIDGHGAPDAISGRSPSSPFPRPSVPTMSGRPGKRVSAISVKTRSRRRSGRLRRRWRWPARAGT